jgi:FkbM family methyltransferase
MPSWKKLIKPFVPGPILRLYQAPRFIAKAAADVWREGDPELHLLPILCDPRRASLDIGANIGAYALHIRRFSRRCYLFEPVPELASHLVAGFLLDRKVKIHQVALSDSTGVATLRLPVRDGDHATALATVEASNELHGLPIVTIEVPRRRLDDMGISDVGFIKIDVEGHELSVLRGAERLLRADKPTLLIEAEERHRRSAVKTVGEFLSEFDYRGMFLFQGRAHDIESFDADIHQNPDRVDIRGRKPGADYVNNFIFSMRREELRVRIKGPDVEERLRRP